VVYQLVAFWSISAAQLLLLVKTLPRDQDAMEAELAQYAAHAMQSHVPANEPLMSLSTTPPLVSSHPMYGRENGNGSLECYEDEVPLTTIAERMTSFDDIAAKETLMYVQAGIKELSPFRCRDRRSLDDGGLSSRNSEVDLDDENDGDILAR
jgi:hypothetical protein